MQRSEEVEAADPAALRQIAVGALARTTGSPLTEGNGVRILHDAPENYPAWEEAIASARETVHMEMYIFRADTWGGKFAALLADRAAAGVKVRVLCDWFGSLLQPAASREPARGGAPQSPQSDLRRRFSGVHFRPVYRGSLDGRRGPGHSAVARHWR